MALVCLFHTDGQLSPDHLYHFPSFPRLWVSPTSYTYTSLGVLHLQSKVKNRLRDTPHDPSPHTITFLQDGE